MTQPLTNRAALLDGRPACRTAAVDIAAAGLAALDPESATARWVDRQGNDLVIDGRRHALEGRRVFLLGAGKASLGIARALTGLVGDRIATGAVVVHKVGEGELEGGVAVIESDHPVPTTRSSLAATHLVDIAREVADGDLVLACFTGGSSALVASPRDGISIEEKAAVSALLLASGLDIVEINTVRKHISSIKGGRLAELMRGATVVNLTVSDVAGDHLDSITDPTVPDTTRPADAVAILQDSGLWGSVPASVKERLLAGDPSPTLAGRDIQSVVVASGIDACRAMSERAEALGLHPHVMSTAWRGDAADNGRHVASVALECRQGTGPVEPPAVLVACGGESTVALGDWEAAAGRGGPNQEFALGAAMVLSGHRNVAVVAIDTDGRDGGTDWAGAVVDGETVDRIGAAATEALSRHGASEALAASGDLVNTGPTGTNVNDLYVAVVEA